MNIETRATLKRMATMFCSIGTLAGYSYLIGGVGGYLFDKGRPLLAAAGFIAGTLLALIALRFWKSYLVDVEILNEKDAAKASLKRDQAE